MTELFITSMFLLGMVMSLFIINLFIQSIHNKIKSEMTKTQEEMIEILKKQANELVISNESTRGKLAANQSLIDELTNVIKEVYTGMSEIRLEISNLGGLVIDRQKLENELIKLKKIIKRKEKS